MGMYIEFIFGARFKKDTPEEVINTLRYMAGDIEKPETLAYEGVSPFYGNCYYFGVCQAVTKMWYDETAQAWILSSRASMTNRDGRINDFLDWIKTYIDRGSGQRQIYAMTIHEVATEPRLWCLHD